MAEENTNPNGSAKPRFGLPGIDGPTDVHMPQLAFKVQPSAEEEWTRFGVDLASVLADLDEDEFLIISSKGTGLFVQFAAQGQFGMRAEAVSSQYIKDKVMRPETVLVMQDLGWNVPTNLPESSDPEGHTPDGSPNFFVDVASPVPFDAIAFLAVTTLRFVFGVGHLGGLEYRSFGVGVDSIRFPTLRIARERSRPSGLEGEI